MKQRVNRRNKALYLAIMGMSLWGTMENQAFGASHTTSQTGATINLGSGDTVDVTNESAISSDASGGLGLQILSGGVIINNISNINGTHSPVIYLNNGVTNLLGTGTTVTYVNTGTASMADAVIYLDSAIGSGSKLEASSLKIDGTSNIGMNGINSDGTVGQNTIRLGTGSEILIDTTDASGGTSTGISMTNSELHADQLILDITSTSKAYGLALSNNSTADIGTGTKITAKSTGVVNDMSLGITAYGNSTVTGESVVINVTNGDGASATNGSTIDLGSNSRIIVTGDVNTTASRSYRGMNTRSNGSFLADHLAIEVTNANEEISYVGAKSESGSVNIGEGSTIEMTGYSVGLQALNRMGSSNLKFAGSSTSRNRIQVEDYGVLANELAPTNLGNGTATATVENTDIVVDPSHIFSRSSIGTSGIAGEGHLEGKGIRAAGAAAIDNGRINLENVTVKISAADPSIETYGIYTQNDGKLNLAGEIGIDSPTQAIATIYDPLYTNAGTIQGSAKMTILGDIKAGGNGQIDLNMLSGSTFTGATEVDLANNGYLKLGFDNNSIWNMNRSSSLTDLNMNGGTVAFDSVGDYKTLTTETLAGTGTFAMRTDLTNGHLGGSIGSGAVGVGGGDLIVVAQPGGASGTHFLDINNQAGASVPASYEHLVVKTAGGGSEKFSLSHQVELGGYVYDVYKEPDNNWYLGRTEERGGYSSSVSASYNAFAGNYLIGYAELQMLIQRLGDLREDDTKHDVWAKAYGGKFESASGSFLKNFDMTYAGFQTGIDWKRDRKDQKGSYYIGGMLGYAKGNQDYGQSGDGSVESKTIGAYGTYMGKNGFYVDLVAKYGWLTNEYKVLDTAGELVVGDKMDTNAIMASIELGRRYHFKSQDQQGWFVEPQVQLSYGHQNGGSFNASNGLVVDVDGFNSLLGRVGTLVGYEVKKGKCPINVYGKLFYVHEFDGDVGFTMNGIGANESFGDSWLVYGIGITAQFSKKHNLYLDIERATGGQFDQPWAINGGYRFSW